MSWIIVGNDDWFNLDKAIHIWTEVDAKGEFYAMCEFENGVEAVITESVKEKTELCVAMSSFLKDLKK